MVVSTYSVCQKNVPNRIGPLQVAQREIIFKLPKMIN